MKVAEVHYVGRGRRDSRRGPTGKRYNFLVTTSKAADVPTPVENVQDALYFEEEPAFRVEWTPLGRLAKVSDGPVSESSLALGEMGYRQKQKLAKTLGLKASGSEEDLDERLAPEVERLKETMENQ